MPYLCANCGQVLVLIPYVVKPENEDDLWIHENNVYRCDDPIRAMPEPEPTTWDAALEYLLTGVVTLGFVGAVLYCLFLGWGWL